MRMPDRELIATIPERELVTTISGRNLDMGVRQNV